MNRQNKWRIGLLLSALLLPFVISSIQVLSPDTVAPIYKLFFREQKEATELTKIDELYTVVVFFSLPIVPGLLCVLLLEESLVKRIIWGASYTLIMPFLLYVYVLIIGLKRSGYL